MSSPLATVGSIKVKLGLLVVASVVVAMVVSIVALRLGRPAAARIPGHRGARAGRDPAAGRRHDLAAARDDRGRPADGARRLPRPGPGRVDRRGRRAGRAPSTRWPRSSPPSTASSAPWSPPSPTSCGPRSPASTAVLENLADGVVPADEEHLEAAVGPGPPARRPGRRPARPLPRRRRRRPAAARRRSTSPRSSTRPWPTWCRPGRGVSFAVDVADGLERRGRPGPAAPAASSTCSTTPCGTAPSAARSGSRAAGVRRPLAPRGRATTGPGVPPADRERAFERFGTLAAPGSPATGGTGLGPGHRPLGGHPARRHRPLPRPAAGYDRARAPRRPAARPARAPVAPADRRTASRRTLRSPPCPRPPAQPLPRRPSVTPPPVIDPLFGATGPTLAGSGASRGAGRLGVGLLGGLLLPFRDPGLALFLVLVAAGGTVCWAAQHRRDPFTLTCAGAGRAVLACRVLLLDADWIARCACSPALPRCWSG